MKENTQETYVSWQSVLERMHLIQMFVLQEVYAIHQTIVHVIQVTLEIIVSLQFALERILPPQMFAQEKEVAHIQIIVLVLRDIMEWNASLHIALERTPQMQMSVQGVVYVLHLIPVVVQENTLATSVKQLCCALEKM